MNKISLAKRFIENSVRVSAYMNFSQELLVELDETGVFVDFERGELLMDEFDECAIVIDSPLVKIHTSIDSEVRMLKYFNEIEVDRIFSVIENIFLQSDNFIDFIYTFKDTFNEDIDYYEINVGEEPYYDPVLGEEIKNG